VVSSVVFLHLNVKNCGRNGVCCHKGHSAKYYWSSKGGGILHLDRDGLYTLEQLAQELGVSVRTLQRAIERGDLPARRLGRRKFVRGADVLDGLPEVRQPKRKTRSRAKPKAGE
jgi:DNA binding domain, excisionase family